MIFYYYNFPVQSVPVIYQVSKIDIDFVWDLLVWSVFDVHKITDLKVNADICFCSNIV